MILAEMQNWKSKFTKMMLHHNYSTGQVEINIIKLKQIKCLFSRLLNKVINKHGNFTI